MPRLKLTNYTPEGELLAPTDDILNATPTFLGGTPTTDPGYYHRFRFESTTKAETLDKARRFFAMMEGVPLYSTLILKPYEVKVGGYHRFGYDIVYAVENPGIR
jgi:hypothetical protein